MKIKATLFMFAVLCCIWEGLTQENNLVTVTQIYNNTGQTSLQHDSITEKSELYDVSNNRFIDSDAKSAGNASALTDIYRMNDSRVKRKRISRMFHNGTKRTLIDEFSQFDDDVGKAYGDPDSYQKIGDGVYIMQNEDHKPEQKEKIKTIKQTLPDTEKSLNAIIGNLDMEDKDIVDESNKNINNDHLLSDVVLPTEQKSPKPEGMNLSPNVESVSEKELNFLGDLQVNLKNNDRNTPDNVNNELDAEDQGNRLLAENSLKGVANIAKAVEKDDKEFIENNPYAIDPDKMHMKFSPQAYKKDVTVNELEKISGTNAYFTKKREDDDAVVSDKNEASSLVNTSLFESQRKQNELNMLAQDENAEILVGGSRSRAKKKKMVRRHHRKRMHKHSRKNKKKKYTKDDQEEQEDRKVNDLREELAKEWKKDSKDDALDTGFFIADETDLADMNKKTENFVENTVNASVVKIIEPSNNTSASEKENITKSYRSKFEAELNAITPENDSTVQTVNNTKRNDFRNKQINKTEEQDFGLYNILNSKNKHTRSKQRKYIKANRQVINVGGKPGVQIDLYITGNKSKKMKKKRRTVRSKPNVPEKNIDATGQKKYFEPDGFEDNSVEDVSLNEAANQDRNMFNVDENVNGLNVEKLDVNDHVEGNEGKQNSDINIQDAINNEDLKNAMEESDIKGFNAIKNELALQDAKSTVDFFNQPNHPLNSHLSSGGLGDLSEDIREADGTTKETDGTTKSSKSEGAREYKSPSEDDPQKVKIILHIPESVSKDKGGDWNTQEALDLFTEQAKAFLTSDKGKKLIDGSASSKATSDDDATLITAKKIEAMLRENSKKEDEAKAAKERIKLFAAVQNGIKQANSDDSRLLSLLQIKGGPTDIVNTTNVNTMDSFALINPHPTEKLEELKTTQGINVVPVEKQNPTTLFTTAVLPKIPKESEVMKGDQQSVYINKAPSSFFEAINPGKINAHYPSPYSRKDPSSELVNPAPNLPSVPATIKFGAPGVTTPLRINGGKVIGGNVRGGNVLGGVISGGDVSGGEIDGGRIEGGTFRNGMMIDGLLQNGVVEGGKIRGGLIIGGDIKSGLIEGGVVKGGIIEGGRLINGTVEGGDFRGGVILGGRLIAGEMDGGVLKNGSINGGVMKGGVIESGVLEGGTMLSGTLRGGIVKSGVINGGIIDKGVVVQDDAEIGPGVEIHDGIVKGGKISVNAVPQVSSVQETPSPNPTVTNTHHGDENRSNIMYSIEVLPKPVDSLKHRKISETSILIPNKQPVKPDAKKTAPEAVEKKKEMAPHDKPMKTVAPDLKVLTTARPRVTNQPVSSVTRTHTTRAGHTVGVKKTSKPPTITKSKFLTVLYDKKNPFLKKEIRLDNIGDIKELLSQLEKSSKYMGDSNNTQKAFVANSQQQQQQDQEKIEEAKRRDESERAKYSSEQDALFAHWGLSKMSNSVIHGEPGTRLRAYGGVRIHNGHALLDGMNGYLDAGDYQGECFGDPEVCTQGFTIQMTLKVYSDSVFNRSKIFILDSGAISPDSRGISVWVAEGRISAMVSVRREIWCLKKILEPYIEKWMSLTVTWRPDKGLFLYINCEQFDRSSQHTANDCENCVGCHVTDRATRLFFGRPNKGPHFKVAHMAIGEISLYERFYGKEDVLRICGAKNYKTSLQPFNYQTSLEPPPPPLPASPPSQPPLLQSIIYQPPQPTHSSHLPLLPSLLLPPQPPLPPSPPPSLSPPPLPLTPPPQSPPPPPPSTPPLRVIRPPRTTPGVESNDDAPPGWPTPPIKQKIVKKNLKKMINPWPTPANLIPMSKKTTATSRKSFVDYNADRRSFLSQEVEPVNGDYSEWSGWSSCSRTCGEGVRKAVRSCDNPSPKGGGRSCTGASQKLIMCMDSYCSERKATVPVMRLEYGTKKSDVPNGDNMVIVDGEETTYDQLENAFQQLKHR